MGNPSSARGIDLRQWHGAREGRDGRVAQDGVGHLAEAHATGVVMNGLAVQSANGATAAELKRATELVLRALPV
jgi:hypothetical protein